MENSNQKIINICFMFAGILLWAITNLLLDLVDTFFSLKLTQNVWVSHGVPFVAGLLGFIILQSNKKVVAWTDDVVSELQKVIWPSSRDTMAMTIVVCVVLVLAGVVIGSVDKIALATIKALTEINLPKI